MQRGFTHSSHRRSGFVPIDSEQGGYALRPIVNFEQNFKNKDTRKHNRHVCQSQAQPVHAKLKTQPSTASAGMATRLSLCARVLHHFPNGVISETNGSFTAGHNLFSSKEPEETGRSSFALRGHFISTAGLRTDSTPKPVRMCAVSDQRRE